MNWKCLAASILGGPLIVLAVISVIVLPAEAIDAAFGKPWGVLWPLGLASFLVAGALYYECRE